jgi:hypothetical protein
MQQNLTLRHHQDAFRIKRLRDRRSSPKGLTSYVEGCRKVRWDVEGMSKGATGRAEGQTKIRKIKQLSVKQETRNKKWERTINYQLPTTNYQLHNQYVAFHGVKHLDCRTIALEIIKAVVVQEEKLCEME